MTEVLAIAGGAGTILAMIIICLLVRSLLEGMNSERASFAAEVIATREQVAAEVTRDAALADAARSKAEATEARRQLEAAQRALSNAREELSHRVQQELVTGSPDDVIRIVDGMLSRPILAADRPAAAAGADHGDAKSSAVQPAAAADAGPVRRLP